MFSHDRAGTKSRLHKLSLFILVLFIFCFFTMRGWLHIILFFWSAWLWCIGLLIEWQGYFRWLSSRIYKGFHDLTISYSFFLQLFFSVFTLKLLFLFCKRYWWLCRRLSTSAKHWWNIAWNFGAWWWFNFFGMRVPKISTFLEIRNKRLC